MENEKRKGRPKGSKQSTTSDKAIHKKIKESFVELYGSKGNVGTVAIEYGIDRNRLSKLLEHHPDIMEEAREAYADKLEEKLDTLITKATPNDRSAISALQFALKAVRKTKYSEKVEADTNKPISIKLEVIPSYGGSSPGKKAEDTESVDGEYREITESSTEESSTVKELPEGAKKEEETKEYTFTNPTLDEIRRIY